MDVFDAIKKRRSIRQYLKKEVEEEKLLKILEAARQAPSASNRQEWRFVIVKEPATRARLAIAAKGQKFVEEAPVLIAVCAQTDNHTMTCGQLCYPIDCAIAIDHMTLAARALDLGTCWIGAFHEDQVKKILNIPSEIRVVELLTLGYPKELPASTKDRLPLDAIVSRERWQNL
ncbi:MAG: nitroreductase family protein [Candidatus Omnitrophica bacterium]|nr:nitroreductase family protein [Candidatus Omnitrophota bacterium]